jgi:arylsulfatase A-like enzyme
VARTRTSRAGTSRRAGVHLHARSAGTTEESGGVNIILVISDSLRKDHLGCYGNQRASSWFTSHGGRSIETPHLDRLAGEGTLFELAYPESMATIQVRRALHTGFRTFPYHDWKPVKWDLVYNPGWQPIPHEQETVAELLARAGYRTGFVTDTVPYFTPGFNFHRGFHNYHFIRGQQQDRYRTVLRDSDVKTPNGDVMARYFTNDYHRGSEWVLRQYLPNTADRQQEEDWFAPRVYREGIRWLQEHREIGRDGRLFLLLDHFDPHETWDPPQHYVRQLDPTFVVGRDGADVIAPRYGPSDYLTEAELRHMRANYAGEVLMVDRWFGRLLDTIDELGLRENTLLAFVADHGHSLGEHQVTGKLPWAMYPELIDIPLLVRHPQGRRGQRIDELVYNVDLVPTMLAAAGVTPPTELDGQDLTPLLCGTLGWTSRPYVTSSLTDHAWVRTRDEAMQVHFDGTNPRLTDLRNDPAYERNLADDQPARVRALFDLILADAKGVLPLYDLPLTYSDGSRPQG